MPVLGCGAEMSKLMDVSDQDVATIEDVITERIGLGVSQAVAQRQAVAEALAQLAEERSMVMKAIDEQLGKSEEGIPMFARKPEDFVDAPDGSQNFGEITPEIAKALGRQSGAIRLRYGDGKQGLVHIKQRHDKDIKARGFSSVEDFVHKVAQGFNKVYKGRGAALDAVLDDENRGMLIIQLEPAEDGDFYDIKTATPIRRDQFKNAKPLWESAGPSTSSAEADPLNPRGQSGDGSIGLEVDDVNNTHFARKARPAPLAEETNFEKFRRRVQDQYIHVDKIQNMILSNGGTVGEQQNVYRAEERMHGRAQEKLHDFGRNLLEPLLQKAAKEGIELDELAAYAYAKHATERNAEIDKINPTLQGMGSGMDDSTAANILQMVQLSGDQAKFDDLHQDLMRMTEATRQEYLRSGLISQDEYNDWTGKYRNYVPLKGFENVDDEGNARPGVGSGLSVKGKETIRALGRRSRAADIIEQIVSDHERAVLRAERNTVAKTFLNLVTTNPNPALWEVQPRKLTPSFDKSRQLVVYKQTPDTADTVGVKVAGKQVYVKVHDPLLIRALTQAGKDKSGELHGFLLRTAGAYTNLMRNTLTRYNPVFGAVNAVRDAPMGALSAFDTMGGKGLALYTKYYGEALAASARYESGHTNLSKDMDRYLKEMRLAGGTTSGVFMRDVKEIKSELRTAMLLAGAQPQNTREKLLVRSKPVVKAVRGIGKALEFLGATSEDAARLAAYRAARELGKTPAEAASIAKNLTTNFNRSGEWGAGLNGLYLFFNAGVQGTTRLAQAMTNPKVRYALAGVTAASMIAALLGASGGGDDDDGTAYWDKIPDFEKERNLIIMLSPDMEMDGATPIGKKGRYVKIPVQYGLNSFMVLGYQLADLARHVKDPTRGVDALKAGTRLASAAFGAVNPFGGSVDITNPQSVFLAALPTALESPARMAVGVNAFDKPIGPARSAGDTRPDSEMYGPSQAGTASQRLAHWLNTNTGGNEARSGAIDVQPATIDELGRNLGGGLGSFVMASMNLATKALYVPENIEKRDVPFWRNFAADLGTSNDVSRYYDNSKKAKDEFATFEGERKLGIDKQYTPEQEALQGLGYVAKNYSDVMTKLRKEEIELALDETMPEREKRLARRALELERAKLAKDFNSAYTEEMNRVARKQ